MRGVWVVCSIMALLTTGCEQQGRSILAQQPETPSCELPAQGAIRPVNVRPTGLAARYQLARTGPSQLEATISVSFVPTPDSGTRAAWRVRGRTEQCLAEISPYLRGPYGEQLSIRLAPPSASIPPTQISVTEHPVRGHSMLWQADWGCPEILHEVFHLLGLVDEYPEPSIYQCRSAGPMDSIMFSPRAAYNAVMNQQSRQSLLLPAQFQAIAYPGCGARNQKYYRCAAAAYASPRGCNPAPPIECRSGDWLGI